MLGYVAVLFIVDTYNLASNPINSTKALTSSKQLQPSLYDIQAAQMTPLPHHSELIWPAHVVDLAVLGLDRLE